MQARLVLQAGNDLYNTMIPIGKRSHLGYVSAPRKVSLNTWSAENIHPR